MSEGDQQHLVPPTRCTAYVEINVLVLVQNQVEYVFVQELLVTRQNPVHNFVDYKSEQI